MKVALLSDCYLPRLGGIEVQVHDLAAQLQAAGHEVEVFTATPGSAGESHGDVEEVDGIPVHRMALHLPGGLPVNPLAPHEVRRRIATGGFDMAHVHMGVVSPFATDMVRVALGLALPTAVTWHCVLERSQPAFRVLGRARRWAEAGAALSAVSSMAARAVAAVAGPGSQVRVLHNGIDAGTWAPPEPPRTLEHSGNAVVRVVTATRLAARKRPKAILQGVLQARSMLPPGMRLELEILGEGPQRRMLQRFIDRHDMGSWARMPGRVSRADLPQRYWAADLYLSSARLEGFGLAALEARTAGLPVVALSGTGVDDFVEDGRNGLLVPGDAALASAVVRLATEPALRQRIARHNATTLPEQAWPLVVQRVEGEYHRALLRSRSVAR